MKFDAAIVGGGPAACAAAIRLRTKGLAVTVIASESQGRKPTETCKPQLRELLRQLGADSALDTCEPCYGIRSDWGLSAAALKSSIFDPFGNPWFVPREAFDARLREITKEFGAEWVSARANGVEFNSAGAMIKTSEGPIEATWLVIATGSPNWAARVTEQKVSVTDSLIAFWGVLELTVEEKFLQTETTDWGWWYICPELGNGTVACFVTDAQCSRHLAPSNKDQWAKLFGQTNLFGQFAKRPEVKQVNVKHTGLSSIQRRHGKRWVAIGDAAVMLDPLGSSGTASALESGLRAADCIVAEESGTPNSMELYEVWSVGLLRQFTAQRGALYESEAKLHVSDFWKRRTR